MLSFDKKEWSYIFYDWAESCITVTVGAFIFPMLYGLLTEGKEGVQSLFGFLLSFVSLAVAALSPLLGTVADFRGYKKRFFLFFFCIGVGATFLIGFFPREPRFWWVVLIPYVLASIGYAGTNVFYDSFLVDAASDERMDRVSSAGYAFGYIGGSTIPLVIALVLLQYLPGLCADGRLSVLGRSVPYDVYTGFRLTFFIAALWWLVFSVPFLRNVDQVHGIAPVASPVAAALKRLRGTFAEAAKHKRVFLFLGAYFLYIDGVNTVIGMAVPFAVDSVAGVTPENATALLLPVLLGVQVAAFFFSLLFSFLTRFVPSRTLILAAIGVYCFIGVYALFITTLAQFWVLGLLVATSQGGIQSLSRSHYGRIIPKDSANEFFGFYTVFGRFAAVLGPALVGGISYIVLKAAGPLPGGTLRYGVVSLVVLFLAGAALFRASERAAAEEV